MDSLRATRRPRMTAHYSSPLSEEAQVFGYLWNSVRSRFSGSPPPKHCELN